MRLRHGFLVDPYRQSSLGATFDQIHLLPKLYLLADDTDVGYGQECIYRRWLTINTKGQESSDVLRDASRLIGRRGGSIAVELGVK